MRKLLGDVERKAFDLFQRCGSSLRHALEDWLQAEREMLAVPPAELIETPTEFAARMAIPGFSIKEVQVTATPQEVIVEAEHPSTEVKEEERVCWSDLPHRSKSLLPRAAA